VGLGKALRGVPRSGKTQGLGNNARRNCNCAHVTAGSPKRVTNTGGRAEPTLGDGLQNLTAVQNGTKKKKGSGKRAIELLTCRKDCGSG